MGELSTELLLKFYANMYKTRKFEEEMFEYYKTGAMPGLVHTAVGQEAVGTGAVAPLRADDFVAVHHRSHAHFFMRGCEPKKVLAEILGKEGGYCKGKGGTIHCSDMSRNILGMTGILGNNFAIATGPAYMFKMQGKDSIVALFSGDSATNEGPFHEGLNMAAAWKLPMLYIIENNLYGISTDIRKVTGLEKLSTRAAGYGIPGVSVDGNDVEVVYNTVKEAAEYVRSGKGPMIVELLTYRTKGHHVGDPGKYKNPEEQEAWLKRDPIKLTEQKLFDRGVTEAELEAVRNQVDEEIEDAKKYAEESPYPNIDEAYTDFMAD